MGVQRVRLAGLLPVAFQTSSLANSTAIPFNSTIRVSGASVMDVSVDGGSARYRSDGTNPTLNTGVFLKSSGVYRFEGVHVFNTTSNYRFQRTTGTVKLSIMAYKYVLDTADKQ